MTPQPLDPETTLTTNGSRPAPVLIDPPPVAVTPADVPPPACRAVDTDPAPSTTATSPTAAAA